VAIAAGVDRTTAAGCANGLRAAANRLGIDPAAVARTRRTVRGGRSHQTHNVYRFTLGQVRILVRAYRPRKPEYVAAVARIAALAGTAR
jgi:DNA-binding SARP family transcriptional activator